MTSLRAARRWHLATAVVAASGLVVQLVLVVLGSSVLVEGDPPGLAERLLHFVSYFTVLSNLLVLVSAVTLARDPRTDGPWWRVLRLDAVVGITVTGLVHWFLLRPLLHLTGWSYAVDKVLHVVTPLVAVAAWLVVGPRPRVTLRVTLGALGYPLVWLLLTLVVGAVSGWYPYPFLDVGVRGGAAVAVTALLLAVGIYATSLLVWLADRQLAPTPPADAPVPRQG